MKFKYLHIVLFSVLSSSMLAQQGGDTFQGLRFYEQLAIRDAAYEASLHTWDDNDSQDYWKDQRDFERNLGKANFTAYLAYKRQKKASYYQLLQDCEGFCNYSPKFYEMAKAYFSSPDFEDILETSRSKVTQNMASKKNK